LLDPQATIARTKIKVQDARDGNLSGGQRDLRVGGFKEQARGKTERTSG
jgi:hypothetical protein